MSINVFVGPTLGADKVRELVGNAVVHPPIAHGDLLRLGLKRDDTAVIIDGFYHHRAPVRHKEILATLACGANVIGCSSMGALRAAELHPHGMIGNGAVFEMYRSGLIDSDEEVALAHGDGPEYRHFSEPLVNVRHVLTEAQRVGVLTAEEATSILSHAVKIPYTRRTWQAIEQVLRHDDPNYVTALERLRSYITNEPFHADRKAADAIDTLGRLEELVATLDPKCLRWTISTDWRTRHLYEWQMTFVGHEALEGYVSDRAVMTFQQLYNTDFPRRWRSFALNEIAACGGDVESLTGEIEVESDAVENASRHGIGRRPLTPEQTKEWLTERESRELPLREATLLVLARSYRPRRGIYDLVEAFPDLIGDTEARRAVAESYVVNTEIASWRPGQATDDVRESVLLDHLAERWCDSSADHRTLRAHARNRGFPWLEEATEAARQFLLRERLLRRSDLTAGL